MGVAEGGVKGAEQAQRFNYDRSARSALDKYRPARDKEGGRAPFHLPPLDPGGLLKAAASAHDRRCRSGPFRTRGIRLACRGTKLGP